MAELYNHKENHNDFHMIIHVSYDKSLRPKFGLRPNLRLNLTLRQRLGLRIFLDRILVLDFCLSRDLSQENCSDQS